VYLAVQSVNGLSPEVAFDAAQAASF